MAGQTLTFNALRCSNCFACVVACLDQHDYADGEADFSHVTSNSRCDMCEVRQRCGLQSACVQACPTRALALKSGVEAGGGVPEPAC